MVKSLKLDFSFFCIVHFFIHFVFQENIFRQNIFFLISFHLRWFYNTKLKLSLKSWDQMRFLGSKLADFSHFLTDKKRPLLSMVKTIILDTNFKLKDIFLKMKSSPVQWYMPMFHTSFGNMNKIVFCLANFVHFLVHF